MKERKTRRSHTNSRDGMLFLYLLNFFFCRNQETWQALRLKKKKKTANNNNLSTLSTIPTANDQSRKSIMLLLRMI